MQVRNVEDLDEIIHFFQATLDRAPTTHPEKLIHLKLFLTAAAALAIRIQQQFTVFSNISVIQGIFCVQHLRN